MPSDAGAAGSSDGSHRFALSNSQITSISGSVSGFAATFAKQPIQRIKWIRQVNSGAVVPYNELFEACVTSQCVSPARGVFCCLTMFSLFFCCQA